MTIGEWVTNALITIANEELGTGTAPPRPDPAASTGSSLQLPPDQTGLGEAVAVLNRRLAESADRDQAVTALVERLDGFHDTDHKLTRLVERFGEVDRRDQALLGLAERLVSNERRQQRNLMALANAVETLARRQDPAAHGGIGRDDLDHGLKPIRTAIETLVDRLGDGPGSRDPADRTANGGDAAEEEPVMPYPKLDYETLNERAIANTRRDDPDAENGREGLLSRVFRGD